MLFKMERNALKILENGTILILCVCASHNNPAGITWQW